MDNFVVFNDSISQPIHAASSDSNLIKIVNEGFSKISPQEIKTIEDAWIKKYSPTIFKYYYDKIAKWTIEHPFGAFGVLTLIFLLLINCLLILLYLISPHKLFSIKSFTKSLPSIKIKYKEIEFSFESVLLTNFLICTDRAITGYYKINCDIFLQRNLLYFNTELDEIKNYLPFPIQINNKGTGNRPMFDNVEQLKKRINTQIEKARNFKILITGNGGIGKTTFCLQLIKWFLDDNKFNKFPLFFLPLDFTSIDENLSTKDFNQQVNELIVTLFSNHFEQNIYTNVLKFCINKSYIVLVIDGYSEYSSEKKTKITTFLSTWHKDKSKYIITSRNEDSRIGNSNIIIQPDFLKTAFLINLIELTFINLLGTTNLTDEDHIRIAFVFNVLNKITNDKGVTPLFCILFTRELFNSVHEIGQNPEAGVYKYYRKIFESYLRKIIENIQDIKSSEIETTLKTLFNFACFFAWKQITVNGSYNLNNYLTENDLTDFNNSSDYLKLLTSGGSILIQSNNQYRFKFDPIAEILVSIYLYQACINNSESQSSIVKNLFEKPYSSEKQHILSNLYEYILDTSSLQNDQRTNSLLKLIKIKIDEISTAIISNE